MNAPQQPRGTSVAAVMNGDQPRKAKPDNFPAMLMAYKGEIANALPRHLNPDRMARIALTEFRKNPKLAACQPQSVFAAVLMASQIGLEPGLMGQCYLIPYKDECQLQIGYQGLLELVRRTGKVKRVEAHVVRDGDHFVYKTGLTTILEHVPNLDGEEGAMRLAYAVAEFTDGGFHVEVMSGKKIEALRDRSQNVINAKRYNKATPWDTDPEEMWRKTLMRRISKYLPKSAEMAVADALENAAAAGRQSLTVDEAISQTWVPPDVDADGVITEVETTRPIAGADGVMPDPKGAATDAARDTPAETKPAGSETNGTGTDTKAADGDTKAVETETKEKPKDGAPFVKYAEVREALNKAATKDALDEAATLIPAIGNAAQQTELNGIYEQLAKKLGGGS